MGAEARFKTDRSCWSRRPVQLRQALDSMMPSGWLSQGVAMPGATTTPFGPSARPTSGVRSSREENLYYAMDVEGWVREGLVDAIIPYTSVTGLNSGADSWMDPKEALFFQRITRGTACRLALNLMPRQVAPEDYRKRAHALYRAGIEHLFFWDTNARNDFSASWSALRRLGQREELQSWVRQGSPRLERPGGTLTRLGFCDSPSRGE